MKFYAAFAIAACLIAATTANPAARAKRQGVPEPFDDCEENLHGLVHYELSEAENAPGGDNGRSHPPYHQRPPASDRFTRPNIVLIVADDLGFNDVGFNAGVRANLGGGDGATNILTPNLDLLAREGVTLGNYYVQPVCTPSRTHIIAGVHEVAAGLCHEVIHSGQRNNLPLNLPTIADKLKEQGYATHMLGKWNLGHWEEQDLPTNRGFDTFFGFVNALTNHSTHFAYERFTDVHNPPNLITNLGHDWWDNTEQTYKYDGIHATDLIQERFQERFLEHVFQNPIKSKPFFFDLSFSAPHYPLEESDYWINQYASEPDSNRRIYSAMVSHLDSAIGNIVNTIKLFPNIWRNTVVVFTTDNGGSDHMGGNNNPLRGNKQTFFEGGVRGVGLVSSPLIDRRFRGRTTDALIHVSDWYPTFVNLARGNTDGQSLYGYNIWNSINGNAPTPRTEILHGIDVVLAPAGVPLAGSPFPTTISAGIRVGDWKVITGAAVDGNWYDIPTTQLPKPFAALTQASGRDQIIGQDLWEPGYVVTPNPDPATKNYWLFNIADDPTETTDLSAVHPDILNQLLGRLQWNFANLYTTCHFPRQDLNAQPLIHDNKFGPWVDELANPLPPPCIDQTLCPLPSPLPPTSNPLPEGVVPTGK
jgi:arylsulfatase A-like enzyme